MQVPSLLSTLEQNARYELIRFELLGACMQVLTTTPYPLPHRYELIRFELLASMARALSSSMQRNQQTSSSLAGSADFRFWGSSIASEWTDGNAGGDRKHSSFVDNPQFLLRAPMGANVCLVLQDVDEAAREQDRVNVKQRPIFLPLVHASAHHGAPSTSHR